MNFGTSIPSQQNGDMEELVLRSVSVASLNAAQTGDSCLAPAVPFGMYPGVRQFPALWLVSQHRPSSWDPVHLGPPGKSAAWPQFLPVPVFLQPRRLKACVAGCISRSETDQKVCQCQAFSKKVC